MVQRMFWHVKGVIENSVEFEADFTGLYDYCSHREQDVKETQQEEAQGTYQCMEVHSANMPTQDLCEQYRWLKDATCILRVSGQFGYQGVIEIYQSDNVDTSVWNDEFTISQGDDSMNLDSPAPTFQTSPVQFFEFPIDGTHIGKAMLDTAIGGEPRGHYIYLDVRADPREDATAGSNGSHSSPSYAFSLDWFPPSSDDEGDNDDGTSSSHYIVDGQRFSGPSRFMNHSCNPNCKMIPVSTHHSDQKIYDLAFFARRDIPPGVELTFDYNSGWT
ncbi:uncharacterized protein BHQ10_000882 [Talaromyces amestolkiae]|uniref:SET domain-containing protein n=1 Tax=Talaromyces amestolkiae TaxID=1196081 RepID=A0A364KMV2_TALAM|nr:uncharacterized protein BHQ10_000882 [Talaromyces amestolkiae]RAO64870.1 hypothetical protein BHQ10_000882 [Talaromyces amestolkiae]